MFSGALYKQCPKCNAQMIVSPLISSQWGCMVCNTSWRLLQSQTGGWVLMRSMSGEAVKDLVKKGTKEEIKHAIEHIRSEIEACWERYKSDNAKLHEDLKFVQAICPHESARLFYGWEDMEDIMRCEWCQKHLTDEEYHAAKEKH